MDKVNAETFALTYGALVRAIARDCEDDIDAMNAKLELVGNAIGARVVEEYFARVSATMEGKNAAAAAAVARGDTRCRTFEDAAESVAKIGFKMFLNVSARCVSWDEDKTRCAIEMDSNPFALFVELPEKYEGLGYCNVLCGAIRGALEAVRFRVKCEMSSDPLRKNGAETFAIRLELLEIVPEEYPFDE